MGLRKPERLMLMDWQDSALYYNFSSFTMKLNEAGQGGPLAPTDSRIRPDIRLAFQVESNPASVTFVVF